MSTSSTSASRTIQDMKDAVEELKEEISELYEEAKEYEEAADRLEEAKEELEKAIEELEAAIKEEIARLEEYLSQLEYTDYVYANKIRAKLDDLLAFNYHLKMIRESFDDVGEMASFLSSIMYTGTTRPNLTKEQRNALIRDYLLLTGQIVMQSSEEVLGHVLNALSPLPVSDRVEIMRIVVNSDEPYRGMFYNVAHLIHIGNTSLPRHDDPLGRFIPPGIRADGTRVDRPTIEFDLRTDRNPYNVFGPYFTFFHEVGHLIDWAAQEGNRNYFTSTQPQRDILFDAIYYDTSNLLGRVASGLPMPDNEDYINQAIANIMDGMRVEYRRGDILTPLQRFQLDLQNSTNSVLFGNDPLFTETHPETRQNFYTMIIPSNVIGGMTDNAVFGWVRHDGERHDDYWFNSSGEPTFRQNREFFAHHFSVSMLNNEPALLASEFYLTTATEVMHNIVADISIILDQLEV